MKIICYNSDPSIPEGVCSWYQKPDTALLRNNDPFYIPTYAESVVCDFQVAVRIHKIGKTIGEKFAPRYYDYVGAGASFIIEELLQQAKNGSLPWDSAVAFDKSTAVCNDFLPLTDLSSGVDSLSLEVEVNSEVVAVISTSELAISVDKFISEVSKSVTVKIGDIVCLGGLMPHTPVKRGDHIRVRVEGHTLLDFDVK